MKQTENIARAKIEAQIKRAQGSKGYFPRQAFCEAKGLLDMAFTLGAISKAEFMELNGRIVRDGINNPEYFD